MANFVTADRVKDTSASYGSSSFTLSGVAPSGFQSFNAGIGDGNYCYYCATDGNGNWELNYGFYTNSTKVLTRVTTPIASSNSNLAVTFSGTVTTFCTDPASWLAAQTNWGQTSGRFAINFGYITSAGVANAALATGTVVYVPIEVHQPFSSVKLHFNINALFAGTSTVAIGIYDTLNGQPNNRLGQQTGINSGTGGSTGEIVTSTITMSAPKPPGMYWVGMVSATNAPTLVQVGSTHVARELYGAAAATSAGIGTIIGYQQTTATLPTTAASLTEKVSGSSQLAGIEASF